MRSPAGDVDADTNLHCCSFRRGRAGGGHDGENQHQTFAIRITSGWSRPWRHQVPNRAGSSPAWAPSATAVNGQGVGTAAPIAVAAVTDERRSPMNLRGPAEPHRLHQHATQNECRLWPAGSAGWGRRRPGRRCRPGGRRSGRSAPRAPTPGRRRPGPRHARRGPSSSAAHAARTVQPWSTASSSKASRPALVAASTRGGTRPLSPNALFPPPAAA
jgi:hypothetical protein